VGISWEDRRDAERQPGINVTKLYFGEVVVYHHVLTCVSFVFCCSPDMPRKPWERANSMNGSKSPVIGRYSVPTFL